MTEFIFAHLWTIAGTIGGLGTLAVICAMFFLGVPLASVIAAIVSLFGRVVDFLRTPVGQAVAVILLIATSLLVGDVHGHRAEMKVTAEKLAARDVYWKAQIKKAFDDFAVERKNRDDSVADEIDKLVEKRLLEIKTQEQAIQITGERHEAKPSSNPCVLTPADLGVRKHSKRAAGATTGTGTARQ